MTPFDPAGFRRHFPALAQPGSYLDSAATALKPQAMIDATTAFYQQGGVTVHRSQHAQALAQTARYESARAQVAALIHAPQPQDIVWTRGATEALNLVAQGYFRPRLQPGDEILVSQAEHHANLLPWLMLAEQTGAKVLPLPLNAQQIPDVDALAELLRPRTRLLALGQMSNVTGGCPDLARAVALAHANQTLVVVDGAQGAVHCPPDVQALDIDFYAFSAHKLYGPTGLGVLYGKSALLAEMDAWQGGGKMISQVTFEDYRQQPAPHRFEAGTPNIAGVIGLSATLGWLAEQDMAAAERYSCELAREAERQLAELPHFRSFRRSDSSLLAFDFTDLHHSDLVTLLAEQGIALRAGQHCAQPLMAQLGVSGTLRASFAPYNTPQDVEALVAAVRQARALLLD
ncbi:cysteine desulfurase CsdA [Nissabacter sp. SGAir0207]|uniref:cysteine desulfurase CsdA n=1 Tax=Nissabacter sp. SGAir0207 TaxID=2126321 RepID=UPI0010CCCD2F|nr:cysteine desulfurase CsdA [Nissabacter sp. SGAir0207]QCR35168.1 cysteine desulfurase CsdA [Nissabacter sp. SGAir0207]